MSGAVCALDVRSVSKSYGATVALQDVSIELQAGEAGFACYPAESSIEEG